MEQATFYRAALLLGLVRGRTVIAWADELIRHDPSPSAELLDLSLTPSGDLSALRHALVPLAHATESPDVVRRLLTIAAGDFASGRRGFDDTIQVLRQTRRLVTLPPAIAREMGEIENSHMLARAGVEGDLHAIEARLRSWLAPFVR